MDIKNGVDMSSFLLVEESADSEVDSSTCEMCRHDVVMAGDEDDAESCSWDKSEIQAALQEGFDYDSDEDEDFSDVDDIGDGVDNERQLNWSSCKMWWSSDAAAGLGYMSTTEQQGEEEYSSCWAGINRSRKVKDEMEDRLFWETCMAVGYP